MAYFVISDIHGSAADLQAVLTKYEQGTFEGLLILGDFLSHGPRNPLPDGYGPLDCIELLAPFAHQILAVAGNCDAHVDETNLPFLLPRENLFFMQGRKVLLHHGHLYTSHNRLLPGDVFLSGHTHVPTARQENGIVYGNPGSISLPKGGYPKSYAVLDTHFRVFDFNDNELMSIAL
jgi:putative phosphoesterase